MMYSVVNGKMYERKKVKGESTDRHAVAADVRGSLAVMVVMHIVLNLNLIIFYCI